MSDCKVIAVANQKGGCGKTVTSTNLGVGLAMQGNKVLICDMDSQASQTVSLGWTNPDELPIRISTMLSNVMNDRQFDPFEGILHHNEGVDLMPANIELAGLEMRMLNAMSREMLLKNYLSAVKGEYDFVILDCPPTLGIITINALTAADSLIIPVQPEFLSVVGMTQLFDTVGQVKKHINPALNIDGILITMANMNTNLAKNTLETLRGAYDQKINIFSIPIPCSVKVKEASAAGKSIFAYDKNGKAAYAYASLVREVSRDSRARGAEIRTAKKTEPDR